MGVGVGQGRYRQQRIRFAAARFLDRGDALSIEADDAPCLHRR